MALVFTGGLVPLVGLFALLLVGVALPPPLTVAGAVVLAAGALLSLLGQAALVAGWFWCGRG